MARTSGQVGLLPFKFGRIVLTLSSLGIAGLRRGSKQSPHAALGSKRPERLLRRNRRSLHYRLEPEPTCSA